MSFSLEHWVRLHILSAREVFARWKDGKDPLADSTRFDEATSVWTVKDEFELVRLVGALQWLNPNYMLWFRGEKQYFPKALPTRYRSDPLRTTARIKWLDTHAYRNRAVRDRRPLARTAILQHYGCPTSLLDVSANHEVACAFAFESNVANQSHLRVYALPRHTKPVSVFDDADVVVVDLRAELPSYCMRPHVQQAAFIARREAAYGDIALGSLVDEKDGTLDPLCIAHIKLAFPGKDRFYTPRSRARVLYPPASEGCEVCHKPPGMNGDYLLHLLQCLAREYPDGLPANFPDRLSDAP